MKIKILLWTLGMILSPLVFLLLMVISAIPIEVFTKKLEDGMNVKI